MVKQNTLEHLACCCILTLQVLNQSQPTVELSPFRLHEAVELEEE